MLEPKDILMYESQGNKRHKVAYTGPQVKGNYFYLFNLLNKWKREREKSQQNPLSALSIRQRSSIHQELTIFGERFLFREPGEW